jgi:aspartate-semialdehyde dehydrogenase
MKSYIVAVVGATGLVGSEMLKVLEQRDFPVKKLICLASERSVGKTVYFGDERHNIEVLTADSFKGVDFALFSAGGSVSAEFAPHAVKAGAVVIDNTSHFRMHDDVPLVVPEVNAHAIKNHKGIIANPNCSTAQMVMALHPIHKAVGIERLVVATYQSVSGAGSSAMHELENHTRLNMAGSTPKPQKFHYSISFNCIPQIDVFTENGYTKEEMKMVNETRKILGDASIRLSATAVRVPVFVGHSEVVNVQTKKKISAKEARELLSEMPGITVMDDPEKNIYPTPKDISGKDDVFVGRIREDISTTNGLEMWIVADNLRKGAALNAVQIAEAMIGAAVRA